MAESKSKALKKKKDELWEKLLQLRAEGIKTEQEWRKAGEDERIHQYEWQKAHDHYIKKTLEIKDL